MWEQTYENDPSYHFIRRNRFTLGISTRTKKGVHEGRVCTWSVFINFHYWYYGYVQINNAFVGTLDEAKQYAENELNKVKEDLIL